MIRCFMPRFRAVSLAAIFLLATIFFATQGFNRHPGETFFRGWTAKSALRCVEPHRVPDNIKQSYLHYLVPTTNVKPHVCANAVAALVNRYPIPMLVGYKGLGEYDAHAAHTAKLNTVHRYLHNVGEGHDDDLVVVVDGFDVLPMFGAEALIERYFQITARADERLADQHSISVEELHARNMRQSVLWGTDKGCFPSKKNESQCWLLPEPHTDRWLYGPKTNNGELPYSESKFLNSGTVIGPLGDLRKLMDKATQTLKTQHIEGFAQNRSDQYLLSRMYARQEYYRSLDRLGGVFPESTRRGRLLPDPKVDGDEETEYHMFVDFESSFTMTMMHNDRFYHRIRYDQPGNMALIEDDYMDAGENFMPFTIQLPADVFRAFSRTYAQLGPGYSNFSPAETWIRSLKLGTNIATGKQFALYHKTGTKRNFVEKHQEFWYMPYIKPLLEASSRALRTNAPITEQPVDGRMWYPANQYPEGVDFEGIPGGFYTDAAGEEFIPFRKICTEEMAQVFGHEYGGFASLAPLQR